MIQEQIQGILQEISEIVGFPVGLSLWDRPKAAYNEKILAEYFAAGVCIPMNKYAETQYFVRSTSPTGSAVAERCSPLEVQSRPNVGSFYIVPFPGCCGLTIATGVSSRHKVRSGIGSRLFRLCELISKGNGYTYMICTDVTKNEPTQKIFNNLKYENLLKFKSVRTTNEIVITGVDVTKG